MADHADEHSEPGAHGSGGAGEPTPERARAAAYLDLWEQQVSRMALHAPVPQLPPLSGAARLKAPWPKA